MKVRNPRTGRFDHAVAPPSLAELEALLAQLRARQPAWAALEASGRAERLQAFARAIDERRAALQAALEADTGRRTLSTLEIDTVLKLLARWAERAPAILAAAAPCNRPSTLPSVTWSVTLEPVELVGVISPWNFPLLLALTDAIPALAAGAAVVVKPSEVTPRFMGPLRAAAAAVPDLPLALVEGDGATGAALVPRVDFLCFTGSLATGRKVAVAAAEAFVPVSLELGGKDPLIVLASADPVRAADVALSGACRASGQACQSIERIYVARPILEPFLDALVARAGAVRPNHPDIGVGDLGPFIWAPQAEVVAAHIAEAVARGARVLTGGRIETRDGGLWLAPTVLVDVTHDMAVMREETFGPVLPVMAFDTVDEAIALANDFGLRPVGRSGGRHAGRSRSRGPTAQGGRGEPERRRLDRTGRRCAQDQLRALRPRAVEGG